MCANVCVEKKIERMKMYENKGSELQIRLGILLFTWSATYGSGRSVEMGDVIHWICDC